MYVCIYVYIYMHTCVENPERRGALQDAYRLAKYTHICVCIVLFFFLASPGRKSSKKIAREYFFSRAIVSSLRHVLVSSTV